MNRIAIDFGESNLRSRTSYGARLGAELGELLVVAVATNLNTTRQNC